MKISIGLEFFELDLAKEQRKIVHKVAEKFVLKHFTQKNSHKIIVYKHTAVLEVPALRKQTKSGLCKSIINSEKHQN